MHIPYHIIHKDHKRRKLTAFLVAFGVGIIAFGTWGVQLKMTMDEASRLSVRSEIPRDAEPRVTGDVTPPEQPSLDEVVAVLKAALEAQPAVLPGATPEATPVAPTGEVAGEQTEAPAPELLTTVEPAQDPATLPRLPQANPESPAASN